MSITNSYEMATSLTPDEVFERLRDNLPFVTGEEKADKCNPRPTLYTTNEGLQIETYDARAGWREDYVDYVEEEFGFRATVRVDLDLARGGAPGFLEGLINTRRTVDWLISHIDGDAVFIANGGPPVLLRKDGKIWLDLEDYFWRKEDLALLTFPYEWKRLSDWEPPSNVVEFPAADRP